MAPPQACVMQQRNSASHIVTQLRPLLYRQMPRCAGSGRRHVNMTFAAISRKCSPGQILWSEPASTQSKDLWIIGSGFGSVEVPRADPAAQITELGCSNQLASFHAGQFFCLQCTVVLSMFFPASDRSALMWQSWSRWAAPSGATKYRLL